MGLEHVMGVYVIWKFAQNKRAARKFLVDIGTQYTALPEQLLLQLSGLPGLGQEHPAGLRWNTSYPNEVPAGTRSSTASRRTGRRTSVTPATQTPRSTRCSTSSSSRRCSPGSPAAT